MREHSALPLTGEFPAEVGVHQHGPLLSARALGCLACHQNDAPASGARFSVDPGRRFVACPASPVALCLVSGVATWPEGLRSPADTHPARQMPLRGDDGHEELAHPDHALARLPAHRPQPAHPHRLERPPGRQRPPRRRRPAPQDPPPDAARPSPTWPRRARHHDTGEPAPVPASPQPRQCHSIRPCPEPARNRHPGTKQPPQPAHSGQPRRMSDLNVKISAGQT